MEHEWNVWCVGDPEDNLDVQLDDERARPYLRPQDVWCADDDDPQQGSSATAKRQRRTGTASTTAAARKSADANAAEPADSSAAGDADADLNDGIDDAWRDSWIPSRSEAYVANLRRKTGANMMKECVRLWRCLTRLLVSLGADTPSVLCSQLGDQRIYVLADCDNAGTLLVSTARPLTKLECLETDLAVFVCQREYVIVSATEISVNDRLNEAHIYRSCSRCTPPTLSFLPTDTIAGDDYF